MLTYTDLKLLKESVDGEKIFYINICNKEFVFKALSYKTIDDIKEIFPYEADFEDGICQVALVYPKKYDFSQCGCAGIPKIAAKFIKKISYYDNVSTVMDDIANERQKMNAFDEQCINLIKAAFPEYKITDIKDWSWNKIIEYVVRAEQIMRFKGINIEIKKNEDEHIETEDDKSKEISKQTVGNILWNNGIDPILYFSDKYINKDRDIMEYPFIGGLYWDRDDIIDAINSQINNKQK